MTSPKSPPSPRAPAVSATPSLRELLARASRTFGVGIAALPTGLRLEITVSYLLLRVADYLEDSEELGVGEKVRLLKRWRALLGGETESGPVVARLRQARDDTPDAFVARHARTVLAALDRLDEDARAIVVRRVRETSAGMARWAERGPVFGSEDDLDDYMHEVAGRVGYLLTELFALRLPGLAGGPEPAMMKLGREFGLALQTVNVIRGLHEDRDRGWIYVPADFIPDSGPVPRDLFKPQHHSAAMKVLTRLVGKAERHLDAAQGYIPMIPRRHHRVRLFCMLPLFFAVRTLALSRGNPEVLAQETKMTRAEVLAVTRSARLLGFSNRWIAWYARRLRVVPGGGHGTS